MLDLYSLKPGDLFRFDRQDIAAFCEFDGTCMFQEICIVVQDRGENFGHFIAWSLKHQKRVSWQLETVVHWPATLVQRA